MSRRLPAALAAVAIAATMAVPAAVASTQARRSFVVYAKPTRAQFINHADDRQRGNKILNPFNADILPAPPKANAGKKGARAGDNALFSLRLYSDLKLTRPVGTATYSCTFNFAHIAVCEGDFELNNGTMIAMGPANLESGSFVLAVVGGTGRYAGAHGQLTSRSVFNTKNTQIISFQLV
jgi:hypothetical protein